MALLLPSAETATGAVRSRGTTTLNHEPHFLHRRNYELAQKGSAIYTDAAGTLRGRWGLSSVVL